MGPIGLMTEELHKYGGMLDDEMEIVQESELPTNIELTLWQELKSQVDKKC